jgi:hypothetical protein
VRSSSELLSNTYRALAEYVTDVDTVYGLNNRRALAAIGVTDAVRALGSPGSLESVAKFAAAAIRESGETS